jgi:hypothetical protein
MKEIDFHVSSGNFPLKNRSQTTRDVVLLAALDIGNALVDALDEALELGTDRREVVARDDDGRGELLQARRQFVALVLPVAVPQRLDYMHCFGGKFMACEKFWYHASTSATWAATSGL